MKDKWEELLAVLSKMLSIYQALLTLTKQKHDVLVAAKSHELEAVTKQEEILILQVGKLEDLRGKLVSELMASHGITGGEVSLAELYKMARPEVVEQFDSISKKFGAVAAEIEPLNKINTELIQQALGFINYNINILSQTVAGPTYAAKGQVNQQIIQRKAFDTKV